MLGHYELVSMEKAPDAYSEILTVRKVPGFLGRLLGHMPKEIQFHGSCTVWHRLPDFERYRTFLEGTLCSFWHQAKYERAKKWQEKKSKANKGPERPF